MKRVLHIVTAPFAKLAAWLRAEERFQIRTFKGGVENVDGVFAALAAAAGHAAGDALHLLERGATWPLRQVIRLTRAAGRSIVSGARRMTHELRALVSQIAVDVVHLVRRSLVLIVKPFVFAFKLLGKIVGPLIAPIRKPFARRAKQEVLADITMTTDHGSHKELLLLVGGVVVILAAVALLVPMGHGQTVSFHEAASAFNPSRLAALLANASPSALALIFAGGSLAAAGTWVWVKMVADAWRRSYPSHTDRTKWRLVTTFLFVPGAIVYFVKVYNHWNLRQFMTYHMLSVLVTGVAVVVATATSGTLWYFNRQASAAVQTPSSQVPQLTVGGSSSSSLNRPKYGAPLAANASGGRTDPFAPIPGQGVVSTPTPSPFPSASPKP